MLYDPKWEEKIEVKLEPWQEILLKAANILEEKGWIQYCYGGDSIGYCVLGALRVADGKSDSLADVSPLSLANVSPLTLVAAQMLQDALNQSPSCWNDAIGRTKEQVVAKLREVAHAI